MSSTSTPPPAPININGWELYVHPCFRAQLDALVAQVEADLPKQSDSVRMLAAIRKLMFEVIPSNPNHPDFKQGGTLGKPYTSWFRAKFYQQYRLFFRFDSKSKVIIFAWVNDTETKRAYQSKSDAYAVFKKMLDAGNPPTDWNSLIAASSPIPKKPGL